MSRRAARRAGSSGETLYATPIACGLIAAGVLVDASIQHVHPLAIVFAVAAIVLVLARTGLTLRENTALLEHSRTESLTDALTGLGNRRRLMLDLDAQLAAAHTDSPTCSSCST